MSSVDERLSTLEANDKGDPSINTTYYGAW